MSDVNLVGAVQRMLSTAGYERCVLLVDTDIAKLAQAADLLCEGLGCAQLSVGAALSAALLNVGAARRAQVAERWLGEQLAAAGGGPVICSEIDLLFEPSLNLDPLVLFRRGARQTQLVVCWPGTFGDETLCYAVPAHTHYRCSWRQPDVRILALDARG